MVELKGSLSGVGLPSAVQLVGEMHRTGRLELTSPKSHAVLAFENGRLVAAECGEHHGLEALGACALQMTDADFVFVEGPVTLEHTLDLGPADLQKLLGRIGSDQFNTTANGTHPADPTQALADCVCPVLGFADDKARHYSRPTALHRCYAAGSPSLVTALEQRDLCLSERFATCPRFRNADPSSHAVRTIVEPPPPFALNERPVPPAQVPPSRMPPRVVARMAAVGHAPPSVPDDVEPIDSSRSRRLALIIGGVFLGLVVVGVVMLLMRPGSGPAVAPAETASTEPAPAATLAPVSLAVPEATAVPVRATLPPTQAPLATVGRPATPTAVPPIGAAALGQALMDVRLAAGPQDRWVDRPPYANWSDGAYRLLARDAGRFVAVDVPIEQDVSDAVVSATFRKTGGPPGGGYGLIVRDSGDARDGQNQEFEAYVFATGDVGEYGVWRREGDHWIDIVPWTRSTAIRAGGSPNELVVRAVGTQLSFTVNGVELANLQDDTLQSGSIGLFVGGDNNEVALDRFNVSPPN
jgi:hypothetical protein